MQRSVGSSFQKLANWFFVAICLPAGSQLHAATQTYDCPAYVSPSSIDAGEIPTSWKAYSHPNKLEVVSAGLSDGEPSDMAYLKPYETRHKGNWTMVRWKLEGEYPKGVWLSCSYEGNFLSLAKELPSGIAECVVEYEKTKANRTKINSITCQ